MMPTDQLGFTSQLFEDYPMSEKRTPSMQARAAKLMRQYLKSEGIEGKVTSSASAGTTSIEVNLLNETPDNVAKATAKAKTYQYGHFNSMDDSYEYSNTIDDLPQVRFAFVRAEFDDSMMQKGLDRLADFFDLESMDYKNLPYEITICGESENTYSAIRAVLRGDHYPHVPFWETEAV